MGEDTGLPNRLLDTGGVVAANLDRGGGPYLVSLAVLSAVPGPQDAHVAVAAHDSAAVWAWAG